MTVPITPVVPQTLLQSAMVDDSGYVSSSWRKWFQNVTQAVNSGLTLVGTALKLPFPTLGTLGGVQASTAVAHKWVNQIDAFGVPQLSQPAYSDISGTPTATSGSGAPASTQPDGSIYLDTSTSPAHGYARVGGAWVQFS